jgi:phosphoglycerate dehydrogenase-like enzyme
VPCANATHEVERFRANFIPLMTERIAILDDFQDVALQFGDWSRLTTRAQTTVFHDHVADEDSLVERLRPFSVIALMRERTPFPRSLIERLPNLRLILTSGMFNRSLDLAAALERGIVVSGTDIVGIAPVQTTFALMLALLQHIPTVDRDIREGRWQTGVGTEIGGKTLGLVGLGRLGSKVAKLAQAFGMKVIAWSTNLTAERAAAAGADLVTKDELFSRADVVSVHLVLGERTRGTIGSREFGLMKPTSLLINTARGPIVDENALLDALRSRQIAGAGLDVYDVEPLPLDHPLRTQPNTVLTPHIGYVSRENYATFYSQMVEDVEAWLAGKPIRRLA